MRGKQLRCPVCRTIFVIRGGVAVLPAPAPPAPAAAPGPMPEAVAERAVMEEYPAAAAPTAAAPLGGAGVDQLWTGGGPDDLWAWMSPEALPAAPPAPDTPPPAPATPPAESPPEPAVAAPAPSAAAEVYVGPRPFETGERLYGRERETAEVTYLLVGERVVLLHSPSGAGKTSLLQAALVPAMIAEGFFIPHADAPPEQRGPRPIILRLNRPPEPGDPAGANRYLLSALLALEGHRPAARRRPAAALAAMTLDSYLSEAFEGAAAPAGHAADRPLLLFFDQFEEILTQDPTDEDAKLAFFRALSKALTGPGRWALFAMREDYQPALEPYLKRIPPLFRATYRLDFLRQDKAVEAIRKPAWEAGEVDFVVAPDLVKDLMQVQVQQPDGTFKRKKGPSVEPVLLQVVCRRVWQMPRRNPRRIGTDVWPSDEAGEPPSAGSLPPQAAHLRRGVDNVLAEYYAEAVRQAAEAGKVSERLVRDWFRLKLIPGGIRQPVTLGDEARFGLTPGCVRVLDRAFLIRKEVQGGVYRFELAHDRLIRPVLQSNEAWRKENLNRFQLAAELWAQNPSPDLLVSGEILNEGEQWAKHKKAMLTKDELEFLRACQEGRRARRHRRNWLLVVALFLLALGGLGFHDWRQREVLAAREYEQELARKKDLALAQQKEALANRRNAEVFALYNLAVYHYASLYGQSDAFGRGQPWRLQGETGLPANFPKPATAELVELAIDPAEQRVIAYGAIKALENRASTTRDKAELTEVIHGLTRIAKEATIRGVSDSAKGAVAAATERRLLLDARITFEFTPLMQFGLSGVGDNQTLRKLTYSPQGNTNRTVLTIDGRSVVFGSAVGTWVERKAPLGNGPGGKRRLGVKSVWQHAQLPIRVTQILEVIRGDNGSHQRPDTCVVGYLVENGPPGKAAKASYSLGLTALLDMAIDGNDRNPFAVGGEVITAPRLFAGKDVPDFVQAMKELPPADPNYVAYFSLLSAPDLDRPDAFLIDNLLDLSVSLYQPDRYLQPPKAKELTDSAVSIYWAPKAVAPGGRRALAYAFGLGRVSPQTLREQQPLILELAQKGR